ncbi:hypothetical protein SEPCBS119000_002710 [Sporothrix epigloea]|uniref:Aminoglycoside phosphotransferase domain-containing protein n=1 Tax=Sporothrix epigloea TaxID=1892477 RepID=A0ABP0DIW6_9PEZI
MLRLFISSSNIASKDTLPSSRWTCLDPWDFDGLKERLEKQIERVNLPVLKSHAEQILGEPVTLSTPFSAGQYWVCFELVAADGRLIIARVRLPQHPDSSVDRSLDDERYRIECEVATMYYVRQTLPNVKLPRVYAHEPAGSDRATAAGAPYMLLEGFYGNTLFDVKFDMRQLPDSTQEHIISQWTRIQAEIATISLPGIGSIAAVSPKGEPVLGRLATAKEEGMLEEGPFKTSAAYFRAIADTAVRRVSPTSTADSWADLGRLVFFDIVHNTDLYNDSCENFPLNHMDLGTNNFLVDNDFNILAVIDCEQAQTAPWAVNYYPMPFTLLESDAELERVLNDPEHIAHEYSTLSERGRKMYVSKFREAEAALKLAGRGLDGSFAAVLNSAPSRVFACFESLGDQPEADEDYVREMVRLAFGLEGASADEYLDAIRAKAGARSMEADERL